MFTFPSRFRRQTAVLTALALVASVLVAVPASAADDDPKADYTAKFDACIGPAAENDAFTDVPKLHANWGDINCIAYYNITMGRSATTYDPRASVNREEMALFLTRLAKRVGIKMVADPPDAGFTDIGDLPDESQTAIAQLKELDITKGNNASGTTYGPGNQVTRGQMALFIARLMDQMDPMAEDNDTVFGYKPEDVGVVNVIGTDDNTIADEPGKAKSPFGDLKTVTKETYDAITNLWELGVASGINDTHYGPSQSIRRDHMAGFMAGVLDHSNVRPAGVTIQAVKTSDFDTYNTQVAVSYRDDKFVPMVDVSVKVFDSDIVGEFDEDGGCTMAAQCAWTDDESLTDDSGNIYIEGEVDDGEMNTYYAWMGDSDEDENNFDVDDSEHSFVTLSSTTDAVNLKVTTDINKNSTGGNTVDIDSGKDVTLTAQLVDGDGEPVAKSGVEVNISVEQGDDTLYPAPDSIKTDDDGKVTYTTSGPKSTKDNADSDRIDTITFSSNVNDDDTTAVATEADTGDGAVAVSANGETVVATIFWTDSDPTLVTIDALTGDTTTRVANGSGEGSTPAYALLNSKDEVTIRASVAFYDQYGNSIGKGSKVAITIQGATVAIRTLSSRGMASWTATVDLTDQNNGGRGLARSVQYALQSPEATADSLVALPQAPQVEETGVTAVRHAPDDSSQPAGAEGSPNVGAVYGDDNRFTIDGFLYTYHADDKFVNSSGELVALDKFEALIGADLDAQPATQANVQVVSYDDDGSSIFRVFEPAA